MCRVSSSTTLVLAHGFAVRDDGSAVGVAARQRAIDETVAWLKQHAAA